MPPEMPSLSNLLGMPTASSQNVPIVNATGRSPEEEGPEEASNEFSTSYQPNSPKRTKQDIDDLPDHHLPSPSYNDNRAPFSTENDVEIRVPQSYSPRMALRSEESKSGSSITSTSGSNDIVDHKLLQWTIKNWSCQFEDSNSMAISSDIEEASVDNSKIYGPEIEVGGAIWRLLVFPKKQTRSGYISTYLQFLRFTDTGETNKRHSICAEFNITLTNESTPVSKVLPIANQEQSRENRSHNSNLISSHSGYRFNEDNYDWGFESFASLDDIERIIDPSDNLVLYVEIAVLSDPTNKLFYNQYTWSSKKETGYVGIKNQGATCYMNSVLQSLYFTNILRKAIYQIPTENDKKEESLPLALQMFFYQLQTNENPADSNDLIKVFGWESQQSTEHNDVQEFLKIFQDAVERKLECLKIKNPLT